MFVATWRICKVQYSVSIYLRPPISPQGNIWRFSYCTTDWSWGDYPSDLNLDWLTLASNNLQELFHNLNFTHHHAPNLTPLSPCSRALLGYQLLAGSSHYGSLSHMNKKFDFKMPQWCSGWLCHLIAAGFWVQFLVLCVCMLFCACWLLLQSKRRAHTLTDSSKIARRCAYDCASVFFFPLCDGPVMTGDCHGDGLATCLRCSLLYHTTGKPCSRWTNERLRGIHIQPWHLNFNVRCQFWIILAGMMSLWQQQVFLSRWPITAGVEMDRCVPSFNVGLDIQYHLTH